MPRKRLDPVRRCENRPRWRDGEMTGSARGAGVSTTDRSAGGPTTFGLKHRIRCDELLALVERSCPRGRIGRTQCAGDRARDSAAREKRRFVFSLVDESDSPPKNGRGSEKNGRVASSGKFFAPSFFFWIWEGALIGCRLRLRSVFAK